MSTSSMVSRKKKGDQEMFQEVVPNSQEQVITSFKEIIENESGVPAAGTLLHPSTPCISNNQGQAQSQIQIV